MLNMFPPYPTRSIHQVNFNTLFTGTNIIALEANASNFSRATQVRTTTRHLGKALYAPASAQTLRIGKPTLYWQVGSDKLLDILLYIWKVLTDIPLKNKIDARLALSNVSTNFLQSGKFLIEQLQYDFRGEV
ncbi:hypothetical protein Q3H58_000017 [Pseudomonas psychrotolerans]|nr:hypothetical protein [Pseudomonas psychrotolerans]